MPSSYVDNVPPIIHMMIKHSAQPARICDVGPGWGKYGLMAREYLPVIEQLDAVEVEQGLWPPAVYAIYDNIEIADARALGGGFWEPYDMVFMIDMIEHMELADGHRLLNTVQDAGCCVLVSTPKVLVEQHDDNNPYETHVSLWDWEEFQPHGIVDDSSTTDSIIYLLQRR